MTAVMCALFSGDENMLRLLVNQKAELNFGLKGLEGTPGSNPCLQLFLFFFVGGVRVT